VDVIFITIQIFLSYNIISTTAYLPNGQFPPQPTPILQEALDALLEDRIGGVIPTIRADETEWETHVPLNKGDWKFDFKELPREQAFLQLSFRQHHTKVVF
jgi:hypothetical protein